MRSDAKYDIANKAITSELTIHNALTQNQGNAPFPEHSKLYNLLSTVLSFYTKEQRNSLFLMIIQRLQRKVLYDRYFRRQQIQNGNLMNQST